MKYIPNVAAHDTAEIYYLDSVDKSGKPYCSLLPTNATDLLGNDITDFNGDAVEKIFIVDKDGNTVIINGYKLVYSSPYKKVLKTAIKTKEGRKQLPLNKWLQTFETSIDIIEMNLT